MTVKVDPTEFAGKRVLVSGGTKGLGRATVDRFLTGGARVITAARGTLDPIDVVGFVEADLTTAVDVAHGAYHSVSIDAFGTACADNRDPVSVSLLLAVGDHHEAHGIVGPEVRPPFRQRNAGRARRTRRPARCFPTRRGNRRGRR